MAWTAPANQAIGTLITKVLWDNDQDNFRYLKGLSGTVTVEDDMVIEGDLDVENVTLETASFDQGYYLPHHVRTFRMNWEDDANIDESAVGAGSSYAGSGGSGQAEVGVALNQVGGRRVESKDETNGIDVSWDMSKSPYAKFEFGFDTDDGGMSNIDFFIGLRQTKGNAIPAGAAEHCFGVLYLGSASGFGFMTGNAASQTLSGTTTAWAADQRLVVEFKAISATSIACWVDGVLIHTFTANLPTGLLDWAFLILSDGAGAAANVYMTIGEIILQETIS